ncbi:MAG: response regulator transcription factor [Alphaproteobacteria bacterium]|nr:response regulator transcription factor [Alphaproteobacteria bacterium]
MRLRVLVAEDNQAMRTAILRLLESEFEIVDAVIDGERLVEVARQTNPDVVVADISMPGMTGLEAARELRERGFTGRIVMLTVHADPGYVRDAREVGAVGYVVKSRMVSDLFVAVKAAHQGRVFVSPTIDLEDDLSSFPGHEPGRA